jgi:probable rRNA maturation factor
MLRNRTDITAKKTARKITVFFSPKLRGGVCGRLSPAIIQRAAALFLTYHGVGSAALSLVFVTGSAIRKINKIHLGHDYVTDIITFDLREKKSVFFDGELIICPSEALRNARVFGEPVEREVLRYVAHGILHLMGYDDATEKQRAIMRREEDKLLALIWP